MGLSPRELQIVKLIAEGCSNVEISQRLGLRLQTVKNRISEIFDKTGVRNRLELAIIADRWEKSEQPG